MTIWSSTFRSWLFASLATVWTITMAGCGAADTGRARGTVLDSSGDPLVRARIIARSAESGKSAYATSDSSGSFELDGGEEGMPAGEYDVIVLEDRGDPDARRPLTVAAKYRSHETSGLKVTVEAGKTTDFNVTLDPP
jgi:hypothetical protein